MKSLIIPVLAIIISITSCTVTKSKYTSAKTLDINLTGIIQKPVVVDLEVKEVKVTGSATENSETSSIEIVKQEAIVDAVKKSNSDILVEPMFTTETIGNKITVTVIGFPANYKNFRPIKQEDLPLLNAGLSQKAKFYEPKSSAIVSAKKGKVSFGVILGLATIVAIGLVKVI